MPMLPTRSSHAAESPALRPGDRVLVLVNPATRRTRESGWKQALSHALSTDIAAEWVTPAGVEGIPTIVRRAHDEGMRAVLVAGGDGAVSRVVEAVADTSLLLGILPLGTGNDLARELGVSADIDGAIQQLLVGSERAVDLVYVNGRPFSTVGLIGVPASSALRVARWQTAGGWRRTFVQLLGRQAYRVSGVLSLVAPGRAWRTCRVGIERSPGLGAGTGGLGAVRPTPRGEDTAHDVSRGGSDRGGQERLGTGGGGLGASRHGSLGEDVSHNTHFEIDAYGCFITNGRCLGSGLMLPVDACTADGRFEICVVRRVGRLRLMIAFACLMQGWPIPFGTLEVHTATFATLEWPESTMFSADGEALVEGQRFTLEIQPGALRVIA